VRRLVRLAEGWCNTRARGLAAGEHSVGVLIRCTRRCRAIRPSRRLLLLAVACALVLAACRSSTPTVSPADSPSATPAGFRSPETEAGPAGRGSAATADAPVPEEECSVLTVRDGAAAAQAPDGRLSGCFRVGPVRPGSYTLHLEHSFVGDHQAASPGSGIELSPAKGP